MTETIYLGKGKIIHPKEGQSFKPFFSGQIEKSKIDNIQDSYINFNISTMKNPDKFGNTHTIIYKEPYKKTEVEQQPKAPPIQTVPDEVYEKQKAKEEEKELPF